MEFELLGWPEEDVTLDLDHRRFSYAGKFVMSSTGKAIVRDDDEILAAASFNEDRTDSTTMWIRYVTVRLDRRGEGIGSRLLADLNHLLADHTYSTVRIAVNNPIAYEAASKAGFGFAGEETGLAELVLDSNVEVSDSYRAGMRLFLEREELEQPEIEFVDDCRDRGPPEPHRPPIDWTTMSPSP